MSTPNVRPSGRQATHKRGVAKDAAKISETAVKPNSSTAHDAAIVDGEQREAMIRKVAYLRSESRGFCPGQEIDDWLAAETEVDRKLANGELPTRCGDSLGG
jgi:Protein of unknown function (DUF2934)